MLQYAQLIKSTFSRGGRHIYIRAGALNPVPPLPVTPPDTHPTRSKPESRKPLPSVKSQPQSELRRHVIQHRSVQPNAAWISKVDFSNLPRIKAEDKIAFTGIDYETVITASLRYKPPQTYRDPFFVLRVFPARLLPNRAAPPFPHSQLAKHDNRVKFGIIATKAKVSNLAVERRRVKSKFKSAVGLLVNRRSLEKQANDGVDLVSRGQFEFTLLLAYRACG